MLRLFLFLSALVVAGCTTAPPPSPPSPEPVAVPAPPLARTPIVTPADFEALPGWRAAAMAPGVTAFARSCGVIVKRPDEALLSNAAPWAGTIADWRRTCEAMTSIVDEASARTMMEILFRPVEIIVPEGKPRFTGYFEPSIEASAVPVGAFTAPVPGPPDDLVQIGGKPHQRLQNGSTQPYPPRAKISPQNILGYAHPADVFFLQIQGSGRLIFPDGRTIRAAYHAHNGQPFRSTANWLMRSGKITRGEASMQGIRAWMDRVSPSEATEAMNANPRYVFFEARPEGDPALGPNGAQGVPLTPFGSLAVDTDLHPLGIPMFVQTTAPGLGGDWSGLMIAQDTGGAINGPVRGDIYFGTGDEAGQRAGTMNAPGRKWVLLPRSVAAALQRADGAAPST
ncbi:MAG: MltA domain-containing protein [Pseudomonadota bacterium]